ncbi:MAG: SDR family oxidoreductase [Anaerolineae bacterium]|jgi:3-oxoacyl-[acyl-carrier protein] reductase|nr:SDR family oxidoreductase [Anaerolineae bacterium]
MTLLAGKTAIVTGAGRGIGAATALLFAQHGARVVISDIDLAPAAEIAGHIVAAGGSALAVAADVTQAAHLENLVEQAVQHYQGIDVLVNNAGYTWDGVLHKMTDAQWEAMLAVHLTAPFKLIRAAAPYLREAAKQELATTGAARPRKIINISSTTGTRGNPGQANYAAGKAGIIGLTKTLAKEWGQFNIQVNAIAFGYIDTRLTQSKEKGDFTERDGQKIDLGIPEQMRQMAKMLIPLGRPGTPAEAAGPMLFFASPLSDYVSGQVLEIAGGM